MDIDMTKSLMAQPEWQAVLIEIARSRDLYSAFLTFGALAGFGLFREMLQRTNVRVPHMPILTLVGALLLVASTVAPVPLIFGAACLGMSAAVTIGGLLGGIASWALSSPSLGKRQKRRYSGRYRNGAMMGWLATPRGRTRVYVFSAAVLTYMALDKVMTGKFSLPILGLVAVPLLLALPPAKRLVWYLTRTEYRDWHRFQLKRRECSPTAKAE